MKRKQSDYSHWVHCKVVRATGTMVCTSPPKWQEVTNFSEISAAKGGKGQNVLISKGVMLWGGGLAQIQ